MTQSADALQIRTAYLDLARLLHPDKRFGGERTDAGGSLVCHVSFMEVQAAWEILRDESSRRRYDDKLAEALDREALVASHRSDAQADAGANRWGFLSAWSEPVHRLVDRVHSRRHGAATRLIKQSALVVPFSAHRLEEGVKEGPPRVRVSQGVSQRIPQRAPQRAPQRPRWTLGAKAGASVRGAGASVRGAEALSTLTEMDGEHPLTLTPDGEYPLTPDGEPVKWETASPSLPPQGGPTVVSGATAPADVAREQGMPSGALSIEDLAVTVEFTESASIPAAQNAHVKGVPKSQVVVSEASCHCKMGTREASASDESPSDLGSRREGEATADIEERTDRVAI